MAEDLNDPADDPGPASWRRGWAGLAALAATLLLVGLVMMVAITNRARDEAIDWERRTYDLVLLTRAVDATIARSEASLGRFVLDEEQSTGTLYYNEWRLAGRQIEQLRRMVRGAPEQAARVARLRELYAERGEELAAAASAAAAGRGSGGVPLFYQAGQSATLPALRAQLQEIANAERVALRERITQSHVFAAQADRLIGWLGWLAVLVGVAAILLGIYAYRALTEGLLARQEAENESFRASALGQAVLERTRELREANQRLQEEATERAAAEAQLRQVQKMEAVGQLTGGIAHDFNNMLAVVVGGLDLAKRRLNGPRDVVENHLDNALEGATRAAALTRRLLAFARVEPLLPEGVAPTALLENMLELIDRTIGERVTVHTRFPDERWHVWADTHQLENAIVNLCVNARDAMEGNGDLTITVENMMLGPGEVVDLAPGPYVRISVADTGIGIQPDHLERVFEPFFTTKPVGKGTGLGLSQIFGFARQSGGDVDISSQVGSGTTVSVYLPRSVAAAEQAAERGGQVAAHAVGPEQAVAGASILVVEDDPRVSRSTVGALEELGYHPLACASGREALDLLERQGGIDLVITDVMMPEMTGPELIRELAPRWPEIGVLFVTGYVGEAGDADELSGYDILRKPFTVTTLSEAVRAALAHRVSEVAPASRAAGGG